jgi:hypothetical protein
MATKIKSVTAVNLQGTKYYEVGRVYNGLKVHKISDNSREYPDNIDFIYEGTTEKDEMVFSLINVPIDVEYEH